MEWVSLRHLMINSQAYPSTFHAKLRPTSASGEVHDAPLLKVQISFQSLFFNNEECRILRIRDITAHK